jgi:type VI secretion system secreted protein Hcp
MAFDAYCYFPGSTIEGETTDSTMSAQKAFEIKNFDIGAENTTDIASATGGVAAGRASFKSVSFTKNTDTASAALLSALCAGTPAADMVIELRRSGGSTSASGTTFLKFEFKQVVIADIGWSGSDGDDVCTETVELKFGAVKTTYTAQTATGSPGDIKTSEWSVVKNEANFSVT